ncbi:MAG: sigma 54-interacting transcriptional regulator, partial [Bilophila wadsworthia]
GASHKGKEGRIALADKGTLFLDEIGELPLRLQSKLLQVIQEKQIVKLGGVKPVSIDFRLVAATNQDLEALVEKKRFRSDLFFRLNVLPLWIPPLRERREEIVPLCLSILGEMNAKYGTEKVFSDEVKRHLAAYSWPGNIRELRNVIERLVIVSSGGVIKADELPEHMFRHQENPESPIGKSLPDALETLERRMILEAYKACGTTTGVAKALGISQPTAARKIAKYKNEASGER